MNVLKDIIKNNIRQYGMIITLVSIVIFFKLNRRYFVKTS